MKTSIWHHTEDQQPTQTGYYLCYRGWGIAGKGNSDHDYGFLYYDIKYKKWYDGEWSDSNVIVYYWTDARPAEWVEKDSPLRGRSNVSSTLKSSWDNVQKAIEQYEILKALVGDNAGRN